MEVPAPETGDPPRGVPAATGLQAVMAQAANLPMRMMIQIRRVMIQIVQVAPRGAVLGLRAVTEVRALQAATRVLQVVTEARAPRAAVQGLRAVTEAQALRVAAQALRVAAQALRVAAQAPQEAVPVPQVAAAIRGHQEAVRVLRQKPALLPPMQNRQENQNPGNRKRRK